MCEFRFVCSETGFSFLVNTAVLVYHDKFSDIRKSTSSHKYLEECVVAVKIWFEDLLEEFSARRTFSNFQTRL